MSRSSSPPPPSVTVIAAGAKPRPVRCAITPRRNAGWTVIPESGATPWTTFGLSVIFCLSIGTSSAASVAVADAV
jgi:hypothetical protein